MVQIKCFRIERNTSVRIEVRMEAAAQRAAVDLPDGDPKALQADIEMAVRGFAASVRLRLREDGRLP